MTDPQIEHLKEMFRHARIRSLSGIDRFRRLTDLRRCAVESDPTKVDRDEYQRIIGAPIRFHGEDGWCKNTDQITAALGFGFNESINRKTSTGAESDAVGR